MINRILGFLIIGGALAVVYLYETSSGASGIFRIIHWPAILLTGVGPFGIVLLCSDHLMLKDAVSFLFTFSPNRHQKLRDTESALLSHLTHEYYLKGSKAFERIHESSVTTEFAKTLDRLSVKMPVPDVRDLLIRERDRTEGKLQQSINLLGLGGRLAPSIGMLGTILGMTQLLASLTDPSHIGSHMSLALLTTFYGLFFSLVLWTPLQHRLERLLEAKSSGFDQLEYWLQLLEQRKPAQYFSDYHNSLGISAPHLPTKKSVEANSG